MKKFVMGLLLFSAFLVVLSGCGSSKTEGDKKGGDAKEKETLRVVTDAAYSPMEFLDKDKITGLDIDFIEAVAKEAGYELKVEHVGWDPIFVEIENKRADMAISSITINDDRKESYDFSVPYFLSTNKILIPKGSSIKSGADLKDKVVAVQAGTTGNEVAEKLLGKNSPNIKKFDNNNLAILELTKGGADAVIADNAVIEEYAKNNPKDNLVVIEDKSFGAEFYGVLFPKGSSELKEEIDAAINKVFESGKYNEVYQKWLGNEPDIELLKQQQAE